MKQIFHSFALGTVVIFSASCGKKDDGNTGYGSLKVQFANSTTANKMVSVAPSKLNVKLKSIIVVRDKDGATAGITYFDLNRSSAVVNADLNSQDALVSARSCHYITMSFLGEKKGANLKCLDSPCPRPPSKFRSLPGSPECSILPEGSCFQEVPLRGA